MTVFGFQFSVKEQGVRISSDGRTLLQSQEGAPFIFIKVKKPETKLKTEN
jgi:hypothetical protein